MFQSALEYGGDPLFLLTELAHDGDVVNTLQPPLPSRTPSTHFKMFNVKKNLD